ncbi:hypothetical protein [Streptomyces sp. NPDC048248]|uniref:hypothetical protein n=1 Tax=Streptomyces sp. NPDC048248 TaxID=3365523 RepID=UPI003718BE98
MSRFEPMPRDDGVGDAVAARVHDPLWMLGRQWQFGEFLGEDAGSVVQVEATADTHRVDGWRPATERAFRPYDPAKAPLERLVEEEPPVPGADPRLRAAAGARFVRQLTDAALGANLPAFVARYGFSDEQPAPRGLSALLHRSLPDGVSLAAGLRVLTGPDGSAAEAEAEALGLDTASRAALAASAGEWLQWWEARVPAPAGELDGGSGRHPAAWNENRLEYAFSVRASGLGDTEFAAAEYMGGRLDWHSFDAVPTTGPGPDAEPGELFLRGVPAPARFGGMPANRFWEMEDARIDIGSVDAAPHDLGRLMMVAFATSSSNDWMVVPARLPVGTLLRVRNFTVTDVFGGREELAPLAADSPDWNLFALADGRETTGASPWFLLFPALSGSLEGAPVESVLLARDEMSNLAWAVEERVQDSSGRPLDRYDTWAARPVTALPPSLLPRYRVDSEVPDHWYPLVPEQLEDHESIKLRLVPLVRRTAGEICTVTPLGALLESVSASGQGADALWLHEEEVPRSGATVIRAHQRARWHDGSVHQWMARQKTSGTGEASSGLHFDRVEAPNAR